MEDLHLGQSDISLLILLEQLANIEGKSQQQKTNKRFQHEAEDHQHKGGIISSLVFWSTSQVKADQDVGNSARVQQTPVSSNKCQKNCPKIFLNT